MPEHQPEMRIAIRYKGKDVDDGTMPIHQVASALQGFASAYGKLALDSTPNGRHQLRVVALKQSSFEILLGAWIILGQNSGQIEALGVMAEWAHGILASMVSVINVKRHVQGQPATITVQGDGNQVIIQNFQGAELAMTARDFKVYETGIIDTDLDKIVSPLSKEKIDRVQIEAQDGGAPIFTEVSSDEREFFSPATTTTETSKQIEIDGHLVSLNKESNRGTMRLDDGRSVSYTYSGSDPIGFYGDFAYRGKLRFTAIGHFDPSLHLARLDIKSTERLQQQLF